MYTDRYPTGYTGAMTELEKGPLGRRRGRGARERILSASQQLFRDQGINRTGMDQLCAVAQVSKRTAYQHFTSKDELVAEYLRRFDPDVMPGVFDRTDLTPRERLLAAFEHARVHAPVPLHRGGRRTPRPPAPRIPVRTRLQDRHRRAAHRNRPRSRRHRPRTTRRTTGAALDGASARTRVLNSESFPTAAAIAAVLIDNAIPSPSPRQPSDDRGTTGSAPVPVGGQ